MALLPETLLPGRAGPGPGRGRALGRGYSGDAGPGPGRGRAGQLTNVNDRWIVAPAIIDKWKLQMDSCSGKHLQMYADCIEIRERVHKDAPQLPDLQGSTQM